jgi:hypothetical protein
MKIARNIDYIEEERISDESSWFTGAVANKNGETILTFSKSNF